MNKWNQLCDFAGALRRSVDSKSEVNAAEFSTNDNVSLGDLYENDVVTPAMIVVPRTKANMRAQQEKEAKRQNHVTTVHDAFYFK